MLTDEYWKGLEIICTSINTQYAPCFARAQIKFAGNSKLGSKRPSLPKLLYPFRMIGDPFVVSKPDSKDEHSRRLLEARKIRGGREATPPINTEEGANCRNIVLVEGNIGIGKTTLCRELVERLKYKAFFEPATENPYLEKFYSNPKKYALQLQLWIFNQRCQTYVDALEHIAKTGEFFKD